MRASSWHRTHARALSSLFLPTTVRTTSSFIAISCVRSIKIPRYARIVTCVTSSIVLFSRRIVAIPSAYNPLAARDWRPPSPVSAIRKIWEGGGGLYLQATNAKFMKKYINFIHAYMQINLNSSSRRVAAVFFPSCYRKSSFTHYISCEK